MKYGNVLACLLAGLVVSGALSAATEMKARGYLFDMDGVLVNNTPYHVKAWQTFAKRHGSDMSEGEIVGLMGSPERVYVQKMVGNGISDAELKTLLKEKEDLYIGLYAEAIAAPPGLKRFLSQAKAGGVAFAIATGGSPRNVDFVLNGIGERGTFPCIVDATQYERGKPAPDCYLKAAKRLGLAPSDCIVFEDALNGVRAAQAAGMRVVAITGTNTREALAALKPDWIVDSFDELTPVPAAVLSEFRLSTDGTRGISFTLSCPAGGEADDWRVFACPKVCCRYHEIGPDDSFAFPWNGKTSVSPVELKSVRKTGSFSRYFLPVAKAEDFITTYAFRAVRGFGATATSDASVAALAKASGDAKTLVEAKKAFWTQGTKEIPVLRDWALGGEKAYTMAKTGTTVVEVTLEGAKPGKPVEIVAWGDNHLKLANNEDSRSDNIMEAFKRRGQANPPDRGAQSLAREMDLVPLFDGAVIMGDNVDFFSYGSYECWKRMVLDVPADPLVVIGYHDYVTHTINKRPQSEMPMKVTMPVCKRYTPNDVAYATKLVGDRVLMVGMDASRNGNFYWEDKIHEKLAADVKRAREKGWTILLFQHEGQYLNTWTKGEDGTYDAEADAAKCLRHSMTGERKMNYRGFGSIIMDPKKGGYSQARGTKAVYNVVWNNADVIRGVFHGHVHANYASWIQAKTPTGELKPIPQYSCNGSVFFDDGWVFKINVK